MTATSPIKGLSSFALDPQTDALDHPGNLADCSTRFLGRQPILDGKLEIFGYELLFRSGYVNAFTGDAETATSQVIDNYLLLMPEAGGGTCFINCTRETLVTGLATLLPPQNTVLEILETVEPDQEVIESCELLRARGYRFALDDFSPSRVNRAFLPFADFIKIDFQASGLEERRTIYAMAADCGAVPLAEKIENAAEMEMARNEGCKLFQGYFLSRPTIMTHTVIPPNHIVCLQLMAALSKGATDIAHIESLVMRDTSLCYRLLRLVNSALYGLNARVTSIRNALIVVGSDKFRKLVTIALAGLFASKQPMALVLLALERARFCELLSPRLNQPAAKLYLLGMLSLIDTILQVPMAQITNSLPLEPEMKAALIGQENSMGLALKLVGCYQDGDWMTCDRLQKNLGLTECTTSRLYLEAVHWADKVMSTSSEQNLAT